MYVKNGRLSTWTDDKLPDVTSSIQGRKLWYNDHLHPESMRRKKREKKNYAYDTVHRFLFIIPT